MPVQIATPDRRSRDRGTALTSYFLLDTTLFDSNPNRWAFDGVQFVPFGCDVEIEGGSTDPCEDDAEDFLVDPQGFPEAVTFPAFAFTAAIQCSLLSMTGDDLRKQLDTLYESELSPIFGEQVMSGVWNPAAPSLMSEAVDVLSGGTTDPYEALAAVEDGLADVWRDSVGMIHMTPGTLVRVADRLEVVNGRFQTPTGHIVVGDAGYQGGAPASGVVTAGETWIYGSSPVHYRYLTPPWYGQDYENWVRDHNDQIVRVSGLGIAVFEPCSVVVAQLD